MSVLWVVIYDPASSHGGVLHPLQEKEELASAASGHTDKLRALETELEGAKREIEVGMARQFNVKMIAKCYVSMIIRQDFKGCVCGAHVWS